MDTPAKTYCGICDAQYITKTADFWCSECDEGLCTECKNHHRFSKASRHHGVILTEDYKKLSIDISNIKHHCIEHENKLQMYCPHHDQLCCILCISTSHKDCTGMLPIDEMAKTSKSSGLLESLQNSLENLRNNIDKIVQDRQVNLIHIKEQRLKIHAGIQNLRKRINSHFDRMEQEIEKELNASEFDLKTKFEDLLHELKEKRERIAVLQSNVTYLKNHASDLQTFIGSKTLKEKMESEWTYIQSLTETDCLKQLSLKYTQNQLIEDLLLCITSFGLISKESGLQTVVIKFEKIKQAQIISTSVDLESVDDMITESTENIRVSNVEQPDEEITNDRNQDEDTSPNYYPRLCHIKKWPDFQGYGFNLHAERDRKGQFIGQIDAGSPADAGGFKLGDRIIEVNGGNVENDSHQQVIQRIRAGGDQTKILVLDRSADDYFRAKGISVNGRMSNVKTITTPERSKYTRINRHKLKTFIPTPWRRKH